MTKEPNKVNGDAELKKEFLDTQSQFEVGDAGMYTAIDMEKVADWWVAKLLFQRLSLEKDRISDLRENVKKSRDTMINPEISYSPDIDITELPEGLIAEMTGFKKGWASAHKEILSLLQDNPPVK